MTEPTVCILVPRREDNGHRDALWSFCKSAWEDAFPDWPVIEGHHRPGRGPFNRAKALNSAFAKSSMHGVKFDVLLIVDADTLVPPDAVRRAVRDAWEHRAKVSPFVRRNYLSEEQTVELMAGGAMPNLTKYRDTVNVSACFAIHRDLWLTVRGFDKRFSGWGGEDTAFDAACRALGRSWRNAGASWHLWHAPSLEADRSSARWKEAKFLADRYIAATEPEQMRVIIGESRRSDSVLVVCETEGLDPYGLAAVLEKVELPEKTGRRIVYLNHRSMPVFRRVEHAVPDDWEVVRAPAGRGPKGLRRVIVGSGQPYVFSFDEFMFDEGRDPECKTRREWAESS